MPKTFGLSHIAFQVADLDRSIAFYESAFDVRRHHRDATTAMLLGPGPCDLIALELSPSEAGKRGGIQHFGIRLTSPEHFDDVLTKALSAGGRLQDKGDRGDNQPFAFVRDPDGYEIEIWHMNASLLDDG
jgi:catechol 2,3-dioxygenase-like lactoylglutathione lyase family enzyme